MLLEDYTISPPLAGTRELSSLALTGWGNKLGTWSQQGRVWWRVDGSTITLYRNDGTTATDALCSGTIISGAATLTAANASGITGSVKIGGTGDANGTIIISYADEPDLLRIVNKATSWLDGSSQWNGVNRFEDAFITAKRDIDAMIMQLWRVSLPLLGDGSVDLSVISQPRQLARAHAYATAAAIRDWQSANNPEFATQAKDWRQQYKDMVRLVELGIDDIARNKIARRFTFAAGRISRG